MGLTTATRPHPLVWQITLSQPPDNRLTADVLHEMMRRFDQIEADWRRTNAGKPPVEWQGGALIITGGGPKFFSNGLDPETTKNPDFNKGLFDPFKNRLLTFPLITIAAINGHSGVELCKMKLAANYLTPVTLGDRFNQKQALAAGIIHEIVDVSRGPNGLLERAVEIGISEGPKTSWGVWGAIKEGMYRTVIDAGALPRAPRSVELDELFWSRMAREEFGAAIKSKL
ncbi:hypothetical protein CspHIS471_0311080 [Cutaneotrichosporon sp. HIS471]|nr:hypothetical protein CspHIS471_0311080 [Cutaneotrichosporon sp. HIS471]